VTNAPAADGIRMKSVTPSSFAIRKLYYTIVEQHSSIGAFFLALFRTPGDKEMAKLQKTVSTLVGVAKDAVKAANVMPDQNHTDMIAKFDRKSFLDNARIMLAFLKNEPGDKHQNNDPSVSIDPDDNSITFWPYEETPAELNTHAHDEELGHPQETPAEEPLPPQSTAQQAGTQSELGPEVQQPPSEPTPEPEQPPKLEETLPPPAPPPEPAETPPQATPPEPEAQSPASPAEVPVPQPMKIVAPIQIKLSTTYASNRKQDLEVLNQILATGQCVAKRDKRFAKDEIAVLEDNGIADDGNAEEFNKNGNDNSSVLETFKIDNKSLFEVAKKSKSGNEYYIITPRLNDEVKPEEIIEIRSGAKLLDGSLEDISLSAEQLCKFLRYASENNGLNKVGIPSGKFNLFANNDGSFLLKIDHSKSMDPKP
jgi:hypothetical protein